MRRGPQRRSFGQELRSPMFFVELVYHWDKFRINFQESIVVADGFFPICWWVFQHVAAKTSGKSLRWKTFHHWDIALVGSHSRCPEQTGYERIMTLISPSILMFQKPTIMIHQQGFSSLCSTENWLQFSMFNSKVGFALPTYAWQLEFSARLQILGSCTSEIRTPQKCWTQEV